MTTASAFVLGKNMALSTSSPYCLPRHNWQSINHHEMELLFTSIWWKCLALLRPRVLNPLPRLDCLLPNQKYKPVHSSNYNEQTTLLERCQTVNSHNSAANRVTTHSKVWNSWFLGPTESAPQTASRSDHPFMHSSTAHGRVPVWLTMGRHFPLPKNCPSLEIGITV